MLDPVLKRDLNTYTGRIWFRVPLTVNEAAEPGDSELTVQVETQACDDERCLPPQTTTLRVPLRIGPADSSDTRHPSISPER